MVWLILPRKKISYVTMVDSNNNDDNNNNNKWKDMPKPKVQTAFGAYGFTHKKKIKHKNETVMLAELPRGLECSSN
jgi:hypothetical protein